MIMLTDKQYSQIRDELDSSKKPLIFFHDDPDGLCSYLLLYKYMGEGKGIIVKTNPNIDHRFLPKAQEYEPDKIFIVDIAMVEQEFIDECKAPVVWIDHHGPYERDNVRYFNPRVNEKGSAPPASYLCYKATGDNIWLAMAGCIGDMYMPEFADEFREHYPGYLPDGIEAREAQFNSKIGEVSKVLSFILKGTSAEAMKSIKLLMKIKSPVELLERKSEEAGKLMDKYNKVRREYDVLLNEALSLANDDNILLFIYPESRMSFTGDLANELVYRFPDKIIIIGRDKCGEMKLSLRSDAYNLPELIEKSVSGLSGRGGGHEHAAGAVVSSQDFQTFLGNLRGFVADCAR
jgi:single-stranded DNA-specific DHH superfamily exonuclease